MILGLKDNRDYNQENQENQVNHGSDVIAADNHAQIIECARTAIGVKVNVPRIFGFKI
jgi:hypothetical protein